MRIKIILSNENKDKKISIKLTKSEYNFLMKKVKNKSSDLSKYCREELLFEYRLEQYSEQTKKSLKNLIKYFNNIKKTSLDSYLNPRKDRNFPKKLKKEAEIYISYLFLKLIRYKRKILNMSDKIDEIIIKNDKQCDDIINKKIKNNEKVKFNEWIFTYLKRDISENKIQKC